jgi:hypothetical protein
VSTLFAGRHSDLEIRSSHPSSGLMDYFKLTASLSVWDPSMDVITCESRIHREPFFLSPPLLSGSSPEPCGGT